MEKGKFSEQQNKMQSNFKQLPCDIITHVLSFHVCSITSSTIEVILNRCNINSPRWARGLSFFMGRIDGQIVFVFQNFWFNTSNTNAPLLKRYGVQYHGFNQAAYESMHVTLHGHSAIRQASLYIGSTDVFSNEFLPLVTAARSLDICAEKDIGKIFRYLSKYNRGRLHKLIMYSGGTGITVVTASDLLAPLQPFEIEVMRFQTRTKPDLNVVYRILFPLCPKVRILDMSYAELTENLSQIINKHRTNTCKLIGVLKIQGFSQPNKKSTHR